MFQQVMLFNSMFYGTGSSGDKGYCNRKVLQFFLKGMQLMTPPHRFQLQSYSRVAISDCHENEKARRNTQATFMV